MYKYHMLAWNLQRPEEGVDSLALELWRVVSHHVDTGSQTWVYCKSNTRS